MKWVASRSALLTLTAAVTEAATVAPTPWTMILSLRQSSAHHSTNNLLPKAVLSQWTRAAVGGRGSRASSVKGSEECLQEALVCQIDCLLTSVAQTPVEQEPVSHSFQDVQCDWTCDACEGELR